jgi:sugar phosphate isomerase/epimerase
VDKLAVSNIAWSGESEAVLERLSSAGVSGIEVAPGKLGAWDGLNKSAVEKFLGLCSSFQLSVPSFQALFFGKPELQLLGDRNSFQAMKEHMFRVAELAAFARSDIMVFGAPGNRKLLGLSRQDGEKLACERLNTLAEIAWEHRTSIALEAVPLAYGGEMITSHRDSLEIVKVVNHPGLVFHLDAACTWLAGDSIVAAVSEAGTCLRHFHVSQPNLVDFDKPERYHTEAGSALRASGYKGWISIEMRETANPLDSLDAAVKFTRSCYFDMVKSAG